MELCKKRGRHAFHHTFFRNSNDELVPVFACRRWTGSPASLGCRHSDAAAYNARRYRRNHRCNEIAQRAGTIGNTRTRTRGSMAKARARRRAAWIYRPLCRRLQSGLGSLRKNSGSIVCRAPSRVHGSGGARRQPDCSAHTQRGTGHPCATAWTSPGCECLCRRNQCPARGFRSRRTPRQSCGRSLFTNTQLAGLGNVGRLLGSKR